MQARLVNISGVDSVASMGNIGANSIVEIGGTAGTVLIGEVHENVVINIRGPLNVSFQGHVDDTTKINFFDSNAKFNFDKHVPASVIMNMTYPPKKAPVKLFDHEAEKQTEQQAEAGRKHTNRQ